MYTKTMWIDLYTDVYILIPVSIDKYRETYNVAKYSRLTSQFACTPPTQEQMSGPPKINSIAKLWSDARKNDWATRTQ